LTASGGHAPYHWSWVAATGYSLPGGLTTSPEGLISGTPQAAGTYKVVVTVADSGSPSSRVSASYPIAVDGLPELAISRGQPPSGTVGVEYGPTATEYLGCSWSPVLGWHLVCNPCSSLAACSSLPRCTGGMSPIRCLKTEVTFLGFTFAASGGEPPYTWTASGLPDNLSLDANTGQLTGKPASAGDYNVTVTVTDSQSPPSQTAANYAIKIGAGAAAP
jgi:putative Ig domain-containing protein